MVYLDESTLPASATFALSSTVETRASFAAFMASMFCWLRPASPLTLSLFALAMASVRAL